MCILLIFKLLKEKLKIKISKQFIFTEILIINFFTHLLIRYFEIMINYNLSNFIGIHDDFYSTKIIL